MIYIRTDANEVIAAGHVMRCLSIADEIINLGENVCFIVSDINSSKLISERDFQCIVTNVDWKNIDMEYEYDLLKLYIKNNDILLVDSYFIHSDYLLRMKKIIKVAVFDDMFLEKKIADIIINYNVFYDIFNYKDRYAGENVTLLLGEKYVPLRKQFKVVLPSRKVRKFERPTILLMCGGGDTENMIYKMITYIKINNEELFWKIKWKIVVGKYYKYTEILAEFVKEKSNIQLLVNEKNMAKLMKSCDLCITSASTVLYECCAMQLPTLFVVVAGDQKYDADYFSKNNMMIYCGNFLEDASETLIKVSEILNRIAFDKKEQQVMKKLMTNKVDGYGAFRIAKILIESAKMEDVDYVLRK